MIISFFLSFSIIFEILYLFPFMDAFHISTHSRHLQHAPPPLPLLCPVVGGEAETVHALHHALGGVLSELERALGKARWTWDEHDDFSAILRHSFFFYKKSFLSFFLFLNHLFALLK